MKVNIGVEVNIGVAVSVWVGVSVNVGVKVGGSGVNVSVGCCKVGKASTEAATWVNPATTVCAAAVLIAPESCNVIAGKAQDRTTIDKMIIVSESRLVYDMVPPKSFLPSHIKLAGIVQTTGSSTSFFAQSNMYLRQPSS